MTAANPAPTEEMISSRFLRARDLYLEGAGGDEAAARESLEILEELASRNPDNPLVLAYLGSTRLLQARDAFFPWTKGRLAGEGMELLDRAVRLAPGDPEIRFIRGISTEPLPPRYGVKAQAVADYSFAAELLAGPAGPEGTAPWVAAGAFYHHGLNLRDAGRRAEAVRFWKLAAAADPRSSFAAKARRELEERK